MYSDPLGIPPDLLNERYGDRYFDVISALDEAKHIHIDGSRLVERLKNGFRIGETGFGAGRLLVSVMESLACAKVVCKNLRYYSVERYPMPAERMLRIMQPFQDRAGRYIDKVAAAYSKFDISSNGWRRGVIRGEFGKIELRLYLGEAIEMVNKLRAKCDAWFLDGHDPAKNPDMWRAELLSAIGDKTATGGTVTTYTVAGHVRRNLAAAGFSVEKTAGHGRKREALRGDYAG